MKKTFNQMYNEAGIKRAKTFHENKWDHEQVLSYLKGKGMTVESSNENEIKIKGVVSEDAKKVINDNTRMAIFKGLTENTLIQLY